eukprot:jgi/Mesvir1/3475/Mv11966-RA.1
MVSSRVFLAVVAVLAIVPFSVYAEEVTALDIDTFDDFIASHDIVVAEFYAPWCGHCKKLEPEYEKAAGELKKNDPPVYLVKVDAADDKNRALGARYGVRGFPTIKIFKKGAKQPSDYNGPREAAGIVSYMQKAIGPASSLLASGEALDTLRSANEVVVVGVFPSTDSAAFKNYLEAADSLRDDLVFAHVTDASVLGLDPAPAATPAVVVLKKFDELRNDFTGEFAGTNVKDFLEDTTTPLVATLDKRPESRNILRKLFENTDPKVLGFVAYEDEPTATAFKSAFQTAAAKYKGSLRFVIGDSAENDGAIKYFGLTTDDLPGIVIHDTSTDSKYIEAKIKPESIAKWLDDFNHGKLEPYLKSEEIPEDNDEPVTVLVAKNFADVVLNSGKDVMIEFYAPWCGHCKKLAPTYEKVAAQFQNDPNVIIAKMVKGFPTIYMHSGKTGEVETYEGDRSEADLIKFIKGFTARHGGAAAATGEETELAKEAAEETVHDEL